MITLIEEIDEEYNDNAYPGLTLSETCTALQINVIEAVNEFEMGILLDEHAYLYENGREIDYALDEAANESLSDKISGLFKKISNWISNAYDKLVGWVLERVEDVRLFFAKKGLSKGTAKKFVDAYARLKQTTYLSSDRIPHTVFTITKDNYKDFLEKVNKGILVKTEMDKISKTAGKNDVTQRMIDDELKSLKSDPRDRDIEAEDAINAYYEVYEEKQHIISDIIKQKNSLIRLAKEEFAKYKKKSQSSEKITEHHQSMNAEIKVISEVASGCIHYFHTYMTEQIAKIRAVVTNKAVRDFIKKPEKIGRVDAYGRVIQKPVKKKKGAIPLGSGNP